ncbi:polygalacturonase QRT3 isoform X2 [Euphorbia lathyris]|uniref:polygalacturonase QRT3 isoform X2 n=1 Tax=Euphorbia lathyris TaxID=212925 RepID=UPI00331425B9
MSTRQNGHSERGRSPTNPLRYLNKQSLSITLMMLLINETTSLPMREQKVKEFGTRFKAMSAPSSNTQTIKPSKQEGRVIYPIGYGADPSGNGESSDALIRALEDGIRLGNGSHHLVGAIKDLGGVVIDLQGGVYKISKPLTFPANVGNLLVRGGTLRASNTFPGDRHLIELCSPNSQPRKETKDHTHINEIKQQQNVGNIYYEDITFRDILFDSSFRGGGILIIESARIRIHDCFFLHFTTQGILVEKGHETFISSCFLGQNSTIGGDKDEKHYSGTGIDIRGNDNGITDVVIFSAAIGIQLRGQANLVTGVHCYNKATSFGGIGILIQMGASLNRIDNCYLDFTAIILEDPIQVHVTNGLFFGDANVVLKSIKGKISGVNIVDNMFNGDSSKMVPIVKLEGSFRDIDQVVIDRNNVNGMSMKSTVGKLTVAGNGTKWVADFSRVLVFPDRINHFQYSFYVKEAGFVMHAVTNVSHNVVTVKSNRGVNGIVSVIVDQYNMIGETT